MSTLGTTSTSLIRGASVAPDITRATEQPPVTPVQEDPFVVDSFEIAQPEPISFPEAVSQSDFAKINSVKFDAALQINRGNTPQEVIDQRKAPRYSVRGLNQLSEAEVQERLKRLEINKNRPTIVDVLDFIDAPRNFIATNLADWVVPEAKRMAQERGDIDQFGNLKVTGGDILRAFGVENRVVNAVGGFAVDILTDPLSFIGGPIGGIKQVGSKGLAIQISNTGSKKLLTGINSVKKGLAPTTPELRSVFKETLDAGVKLGQITADADDATKAAFLRGQLLGKTGRVSEGLGRVGLGRLSRGGLLVEDNFRAIADDATDEISLAIKKRVGAIKAFNRKFANNSGLDLSRGRGGAEILHFPLTPATLTVPAFTIPGTTARLGRLAEMQVAASNFLTGKLREGALAARLSGIATNLETQRQELTKLREARSLVLKQGVTDTTRIDELAEQARKRIEELAEEVRSLDAISPIDIAKSTTGPKNLGDLMVMAGAREEALINAQLERVNARAEILDTTKDIQYRATRADVRRAREFRRTVVADEVRRLEVNRTAARSSINTARKLLKEGSPDLNAAQLQAQIAESKRIVDENTRSLEILTDDAASPERHARAIADLVAAKRERAGVRVQALLDASDDELVDMEAIADSFNAVVSANARLAQLRGGDMLATMTSDDRLLAEGARMMMGISDVQTGTLPLQSLENVLRITGNIERANTVRDLGNRLVVDFGAQGGTIAQAVRAITNGGKSLGDARAAAAINRIGIDIGNAISKTPTVKGSDFDTVMELAGMRLEQEMINRGREAGFVDTASQLFKGTTRNRKILEQAQRRGLLSDPGFRQEVDEIVQRSADMLEQFGREAVLRGDFSDPLAIYVPVMLKSEAARRANILRSSDNPNSQIAAEIIESAGGGTLDPSKRRILNMVAFEDLEGTRREFTIAEAMAYHKATDAEIASLRTLGFTTQADVTEEVRDGVLKFLEAKGANKNISSADLRDLLQSESLPMTPGALNEWAESGRLDPLVGGALAGENPRDFFETNIMSMVYSSVRAHEVARSKESFREMITPFIQVAGVDLRTAEATRANSDGILRTGQEFKFFGDGRRMQIGNITYRRISSLQESFPHDSVFDVTGMLGGDLKRAFIPESLAVQLERAADQLRPEPMSRIMATAESVTKVFRAMTLAHPSWFVTNVIGNTFLAGLAGALSPGRIVPYTRNSVLAVRMLAQRNMEDLSARSVLGNSVRQNTARVGKGGDDLIPVAGADMTVGDFFDLMTENGVLATLSEEQADFIFNQQQRLFPNAQVSGPFGRQRGRFSENLAQIQSTQSVGGRFQTASNTIRAASKSIAPEKARSFFKGWFKVNGMADQVPRIAFFKTLLDEGVDAAEAGRQVREAFLNFGDLSSVENNKIRPLIPFYSWVKASLPNIIHRSIKDPKLLSSIPKITEGLETLTAGEDRVPKHMRPRWIQETMGIQIGTDPQTRQAFLLGTLLPQEGALQVIGGAAGAVGAGASLFTDEPLDFDGNDFMDAVNWLATQLGPIPRVPLEIGARKEFFSGREIGVKEGEGEITLNEFLFNQVRPIKELGLGLTTGSTTEAFGRSTAQGITRLFLGGRVQPALQEGRLEVSASFDLRDREADVRKAIRLAEKQGDEEKALKMRFQLLKVYAEHIKNGGSSEDVPKWALADMARFGLITESDENLP